MAGDGDDKKAPSRTTIEGALRRVVDPEVHINILDLGLVYDLDIGPGGHIHVVMTLTTPACPLGMPMKDAVKKVVGELEGVSDVDVDLVFDPLWTPEFISEAGKEALETTTRS